MVGSPVLLLLLTLGLCCPGIRAQRYSMAVRFRDRTITHPQLEQQLELECESSKEDSGIFWVHLDKDQTLHFIVFISYLHRTTFQGNKQTSPRFEATKVGRFYRLVVKSFMSQDEGYYFCFMNINQMLFFSPGQPAFLQVISTAAPTTLRGVTGNNTHVKTLDQDTISQKDLGFFCDIFIWVPLASACLLLLFGLVFTILMCQQTRRRRCRCKRPMNGKLYTKPVTPSRHV
ncbi:T-cell surface glycoprotein CD8 alpha chain isoform X1 [Cuculus canorus]|uniref:T-cell surface glycoprotein CD8 alpha chain isoform X1 n=1 Tax=Cuculus canorus TaxID=55661 RepID=UPI0023AA97CA|nr:T-cell surface glycoprotein CD8 alpha chain isoform X1 [Cuculus canorus]